MRSERRGFLIRCAVVALMLLVTMPMLKAAQKGYSAGQWARPVGLKQMPQKAGDWNVVRDSKLDDFSLSLLKPDDYVSRVYEDNAGRQLDFLVVYGHLKQTFHSPGFCLPGGGWQIVSKSDTPVTGLSVPMDMNLFHLQHPTENGMLRAVVLYSFTQGDNATPSLFRHNWNLLMAHVRRDRPTGALVRVMVPIYTTEEDAVQLGKDFIHRIYPDLRKRVG